MQCFTIKYVKTMKISHYLIASETNKFRPWVITPQAILLFSLVVLGVRVLTPEVLVVAAPGIDPGETMRYINQGRTSRFLPELMTNEKLLSAAAKKSNDMLNRGYFAHLDPDGNYVWPTIEAEGYYPYKTLGENLAMDYSDARTMVDAWMNSPTHRANVLNDKYEDQGLSTVYGFYKNDHYSILATSLFGALIKTVSVPETSQPPPAQTKPTSPVKPSVLPAESEQPTAEPEEPTKSETELNLSSAPGTLSQVKINPSTEAGKTVLNIEVKITGKAKKISASLLGISTELAPVESVSSYYGSLSVPALTDLSNAELSIQIEQIDGAVTTSKIGLEKTLTSPQEAAVFEPRAIASEKETSNTIKIILTILAGLFAIFLVIDSIIIHRAALKGGVHHSTHTLLLLVLLLMNIFSIFYY